MWLTISRQQLNIIILDTCLEYKDTDRVISLFGSVLLLSGTGEWNCHNPQASRSNYHGYLHVLKYLLFIIIILKQKGVTQTYMLADV